MRGRGLTVLRVKVQRIRRQGLAVAAVVHVEVKRSDLQRSFIGNGHARVFLKGHGEVGVQSLVRSYRQRKRLIEKVVSQTEAKKVADGSLRAGRRLSVPIHPQHERLQVI